jgi:hypothetical protein
MTVDGIDGLPFQGGQDLKRNKRFFSLVYMFDDFHSDLSLNAKVSQEMLDMQI